MLGDDTGDRLGAASELPVSMSYLLLTLQALHAGPQPPLLLARTPVTRVSVSVEDMVQTAFLSPFEQRFIKCN